MTSVSDILVVLYVDDTFPNSLSLNFTLTSATHSDGTVTFQVTRTPGVEPPALSTLIVTLPSEIEFRNSMHKYKYTLITSFTATLEPRLSVPDFVSQVDLHLQSSAERKPGFKDMCVANYPAPEAGEQFCPPTSTLLSTTRTSDDTIPSIFSPKTEFSGSPRGDPIEKIYEGVRMT